MQRRDEERKEMIGEEAEAGGWRRRIDGRRWALLANLATRKAKRHNYQIWT